MIRPSRGVRAGVTTLSSPSANIGVYVRACSAAMDRQPAVRSALVLRRGGPESALSGRLLCRRGIDCRAVVDLAPGLRRPAHRGRVHPDVPRCERVADEGSAPARQFADVRHRTALPGGKRRFRLARPWSTSMHASVRGEAAVPDDEGVVAWVDGPRDGSSITQVAVGDEALSSGHELAVSAPGANDLLTGTSPKSDRGGLRSTTRHDLTPPITTRGVARSRRTRSADILLITRRRNI